MNKDRDRDDRPRDDRPRDDRPRDDRPRDDRPREERSGGNDRPRYGDRNDRPREERSGGYDRPRYGDRNDRPRDDRGGDRNDRPRYGDRNDRPREERSGGYDRPRYGDRNDRPREERSGGYDRPRYGDRNDRPRDDREDNGVYAEKLRAGKRRTYFFDIRTTRSNDFYLTITESKKRFDDTQERHKMHVYKEDLNKFLASLQKAIDYMKTELLPDYDFDEFNHEDGYDEQGAKPYSRYREEESISDEVIIGDEIVEDNGNGDEFVDELSQEENAEDANTDEDAEEPQEDDLKWD